MFVNQPNAFLARFGCNQHNDFYIIFLCNRSKLIHVIFKGKIGNDYSVDANLFAGEAEVLEAELHDGV